MSSFGLWRATWGDLGWLVLASSVVAFVWDTWRACRFRYRPPSRPPFDWAQDAVYRQAVTVRRQDADRRVS